MQQLSTPSAASDPVRDRIPEAQQAMAFRRDLERRIVLAEAVAEMRRQGRPECELADLFSDFKGIQVTLAVVSRALIEGRTDCKTTGRLLVHLQTMSKLLWTLHRKKKPTTEARRHLPHQAKTGLVGDPGGEQQGTPQICADERRLKAKIVPLINTDNTDLSKHKNLMVAEERSMSGIHGEELRAAVDRNIRAFPEESRNMQHGKWEQTRAA